MDDLIKLATGGISSTSAMGEGVTESIIHFYAIANISAIHGGEEIKIIE
jgi:hypothetical protein